MHEPVTAMTTSQVARRFYVDASTVRGWVRDGKLLPLLTTPGGHYRFDPAVIDDFAESLRSPAAESDATDLNSVAGVPA